MYMKRYFPALVLLMCLCLLFAGCDLRSILPDSEAENAPVSQLSDQPVNTAVVITQTAALYDAPNGSKVGELAQGATVTFTETSTVDGVIWVRCISPVADTWLPLSELQISGSTITYITGTDGNVVGSGTVIWSDGTQVLVGPDGYVTGGTVVIPGIEATVDVVGTWECIHVDEIARQDGYGGAYGNMWVFCENGYAVFEQGYGYWSSEEGYLLNYTDTRLYGSYEISGTTLTFTVVEDWYCTTGENIGNVMIFQLESVGGDLLIDGETYCLTDESAYMEEIRNANGGATGNDATDKEWHSGTFTDGTQEMIGTWVSFERINIGLQKRRMWIFHDGNLYTYREDTFEEIGGSWCIPPDRESVYESYGYFLRDGQLYIEVGPDIWGPYILDIQGDTMTVTYTDHEGNTESFVYTRTNDSEPKP